MRALPNKLPQFSKQKIEKLVDAFNQKNKKRYHVGEDESEAQKGYTQLTFEDLGDMFVLN